MTDEENAEVNAIALKIVDAVYGHHPALAISALTQMSTFFACQAETYEKAMTITVSLTQHMQEKIALHFNRNENNAVN